MSNGDRVSGRLLICARPVSQGCKVTCDSVSGSTSQFYAFPLPGVLRCSLENMKNVKQRLKNQREVMSLVNKKISDAQQRGTFYSAAAFSSLCLRELRETLKCFQNVNNFRTYISCASDVRPPPSPPSPPSPRCPLSCSAIQRINSGVTLRPLPAVQRGKQFCKRREHLQW